jgi:hypothetical protein
MIFRGRNGIWEFDEKGQRRLDTPIDEHLLGESGIESANRFWKSESERLAAVRRGASNRLLVTSIILIVLGLWSLAVVFEIWW